MYNMLYLLACTYIHINCPVDGKYFLLWYLNYFNDKGAALAGEKRMPNCT
jgi:hypothetical protein